MLSLQFVLEHGQQLGMLALAGIESEDRLARVDERRM